MKYKLPKLIYLLTLYGLFMYHQVAKATAIVTPLADGFKATTAITQPQEATSTPIVTPDPTPDLPALIPIPEWEQIAKEIIDVFKNEGKETTAWALRCFYSESGWRSDAYNWNTDGSEDRGPAQINSIHKFNGNLHDYKYNIRKALTIYKRQGKSAWYGSQCD